MTKLFLLLLLGATMVVSGKMAINPADEHINHNREQAVAVPVLEDKPRNFNLPTQVKHHSTIHAEGNHTEGKEHHGIHVASWRWDEIGIYITFITFIIVAGLAKVGN